jgi:tetratricopeptide (TPR) repeat protein
MKLQTYVRAFVLVAVFGHASSELQAAPANSCDRYQAANNSALHVLQNTHIDTTTRFEAAARITGSVLAKDPRNFEANRILALVHLYSAGTNHKTYLAAVNELIKTATLLDGVAPACARSMDYYRIYNTIGAEYYNDSDFDLARQYYGMAYANFDKLSDQSKGWLHANLALLAFHQNDYGCAYKGYVLAMALGDKSPDVLENFGTTVEIFKKARVVPKCLQSVI